MYGSGVGKILLIFRLVVAVLAGVYFVVMIENVAVIKREKLVLSH